MNIVHDERDERMNRKRLLYGVAIVVAVVVVVVVLVIMFFPTAPPSPLFTVTGKQQPTESIHADYLENNYEVISWNFTVVYNGENALQNVNIYRNSMDLPIKVMPEVTKGWKYEKIWTPGDISANAIPAATGTHTDARTSRCAHRRPSATRASPPNTSA